jgi:hypothetical protein
MTKHAEARRRQRAIPPILIDLLLQFGATEKSGSGTSKFFFDKKARRKLQTYAGPIATLLDEHLNVYAVVSADDSIITVGHRYERIRRH